MVLGHEGAGVVEALGEGVTSLAVGDPVALCFVPPCGACAACLAGRRNLCEQAAAASLRGTLLDGTSRLRASDGTPLQHGLMTACFAEHAVVAASGVARLPADLPLWQAALLGCGVMTGFGAVRNAARVRPGESVVVVGVRRRRAPGDRRREARRRRLRSSRSIATRRSSHSRSSAGPITPSTPRRRSASSGRSGR